MRVILLAMCVAFAACGGDENPFGSWTPDATQKQVQGAWTLTRMGKKVAVEIAGKQVTVWDGEKETKYELVIHEPCEIGFKEPGQMGSTEYYAYLEKDGQPIFGTGDAGVRTGKKAVVCASISTYIVDGTSCRSRMGDRGAFRDDKCGFRKDGDKEVFFYEFASRESTVPVEGDLIWKHIKDDHAVKAADFAAAKAALAAAPQ